MSEDISKEEKIKVVLKEAAKQNDYIRVKGDLGGVLAQLDLVALEKELNEMPVEMLDSLYSVATSMTEIDLFN